ATGADGRRTRKCRGFVGNQGVAALARLRHVLLHRGVLGVELPDGVDMGVLFDAGYEAFESFRRGHRLLMTRPVRTDACRQPRPARTSSPAACRTPAAAWHRH